jgi:hypothetical protein
VGFRSAFESNQFLTGPSKFAPVAPQQKLHFQYLQSHAKQRFLYRPNLPLPNLSDYMSEVIEVRIYSEYLTTFNKAYKKRHFFGSDIYTSDSDAVCILQHVNVFKPTD